MLLRVRDETADIGHESVVRSMCIHGDDVVETFFLNASEADKRHMPAHVPSLAIFEEGFFGGRRRRIILSVVLPPEQIGDCPMRSVIAEVLLAVTKKPRFMGVEIAARDHGQVVGIRIMIEVAEIGEACAFLGQAFQKVVLDRGLVVLVFEDDNEYVVEMLWWRRRSGLDCGVLRKAENCEDRERK
jgi:hypothetical protein